MSISIFSHPVLGSLFERSDIANYFAFEADLYAMLEFEAALASAQADVGLFSRRVAEEIGDACQRFQPNVEKLRQKTAVDGVIVPELIRQLKAELNEEAADKLHFGSTSQDVVDTSLMLRLKSILSVFSADMEKILQALSELDHKFGDRKIFARTRLQHAYEVTVSHRIREWSSPIRKLKSELEFLQDKFLLVQLGGAAGDLNKLGEKGAEVRSKLAEKLQLTDPEGCWHTDRIAISKIALWLTNVTTAAGKLGMDISLMAVNEVSEIALSGGGGSSAMPHKQNPVVSELLMTLAYFNDCQLSAIQTAALQEFERSGSRWTLEWMVLPQMVMATGASLMLGNKCLQGIQEIGKD
ncbi:3-carboxy-cis,cis-muconate cycloisomerase [Sneathiella glossodoripedis]|uniref:3-carboxy-cis,cis-muconate cycloisomerase n=1 Tax=Sneathiella glossodoripedis TaxID=418853 RepID=UPI000471C75C|nr:3-carboxy-cis,cis-muconate cycloisomerase [Sneathiella glossodoripedis]